MSGNDETGPRSSTRNNDDGTRGQDGNVWNGRGQRIFMQEVGARDGLQIEAAFVPTADKIALVDALSQTGVAKIEVTAFVSPQAIPALRDADDVLRGIQRTSDVCYTALVPNLRGAERAIDAQVDEINTVMSATQTHNLANLRMTREQSFAALTKVMQLARDSHVPVNASLSCCFGCPMEGDVDQNEVLDWSARLIDAGAHGISLCDTTGMAYPTQVSAMVAAFRGRFGNDVELTLHFHNTRGMGLSNILASIAAGANRFDAAIGGLGGCPYAPGATGNVCSEEIVHALQCMGYDTGVDLEKLMAASRRLPALIGHDVPSQLLKAGRRLDLHPVPADFDAIRERALARG